MLGLVRDGRDARRGLVGIACRRKNFRPDPLPRSVEAVVRALQQRAERQIAAADNDRIEDLFVVPAALQAGEASCGTRQQPARLRQGEREMIHAGPIAKAQREIGRPSLPQPGTQHFVDTVIALTPSVRTAESVVSACRICAGVTRSIGMGSTCTGISGSCVSGAHREQRL
jgi:hypothetical protein